MSRLDTVMRLVAPLVRPIYSGSGLILMYHRIVPNLSRSRIPGNSPLESTQQQLETTLEYFAKHSYVPISPDDLYKILKGETKLSRPFVLFTFDDGYADNLANAYPIFKKYNVPFTIHLTTGYPERHVILWWYLLEDLVLNQERITFDCANQVYEFDCSTQDGKASTFAQIRNMLKFANAQTYPQLIKAIFKDMDLYRLTDELALTWNQVKQLAADPLVTISAHTCSHYVLSQLRENEAHQEISESKRILEMQLDRPVEHFAYPFGYRREAGEREFRLAGECGFKTAMTTRYGNIFPAHRDYLMSLPRYDISRTPTLEQLNPITSGVLALRFNKFKRFITI